MLDTFRENARGWGIQLTIGAITLVFIFSFGPGSRGCRSEVTQNEWAAKVNGREVPANVFADLYAGQVNRLMQYGMGSPEQLKQLKVRENVMTEVVEQELLAQAAEKSGLYVSDEELAKAVRRSGSFNDPETGKFDPEAYRRYTQSRESVKSFESRTRRALLAAREAELVMGAITVSDEDLKTAIMKRDEAASIAYVKFLPGNFRDAGQATSDEIDAFLKDHSAEVQKRFDETKVLYTEPRGLKARRLFVPVKPNATPEEEAAAKKKIDEAKVALDGGKKWEELAIQFTGDPMTGGDLGFVQLGRSTLSKITEEAVFKLSPGQTSEVVRDKFGYEIIQVMEEKAPSEKKFDDVKKDIAGEMVKENKAKDLAKAAAQKALDALKAGQPLEAQYPKQEKPEKGAPPVSPEEQKKLHTVVTDEFHPNGGMVPSAGSVPKVSAVAFSLGADKRIADAVIEDGGAFWVVELKSRKRADLSKIAAEKDTLSEKITEDKRRDQRKLWVEKLKKDAKIEENEDFKSYDRKARAPGMPEEDM